MHTPEANAITRIEEEVYRLREINAKMLGALEEATEALGHVTMHGVPHDPANEQRKRAYGWARIVIAEAKGAS